MSTGTMIPDFKTKANNSEGGDYDRPPTGQHPAVLVALIDLGTTESTFRNSKTGKDETKDRHKIALAWELTAEHDSKGETFVVLQDYTWSLAKNAGLRPIVKGFLGRDLADQEEYDLAEMLGKPCCVTLTDGISNNGKKFVEVASVSQPMRGLTVPPATKPIYAFLLGMINSTLDEIAIPAWVPKLYGRYVLDDIKASKEYAKLPNF